MAGATRSAYSPVGWEDGSSFGTVSPEAVAWGVGGERWGVEELMNVGCEARLRGVGIMPGG